MNDLQTHWERYCQSELARVRPILDRLGFALDEAQIHLGGERAIISGNKLVLMGKRTSDGKRVVIKASSDADGKNEMKRERDCRRALDHIRFAYHLFLSPEQLIWHEEDGLLISITAFIEQDKAFLDRSLSDQFFLALHAFETQEGAHAATYEHGRMVRGTFGLWHAEDYLRRFLEYQEDSAARFPQAEVQTSLARANYVLTDQRQRLEQYCGFLTHTDFVPHNIRVVGKEIYLLDHSSIRFGNKHDGWARFLNFMLLHHRALEQALEEYVRLNRAPEEAESLRLMRLYRLGEIINYYIRRREKTSGDLRTLDEARVLFWTDVLRAFLDGTPVSDERIKQYQTTRDALRSEQEKQRQHGLH